MDNFKLQQYHADFQSLMSCVESNQENFNFLIRLMRRNVVIPFIGAGFSANFGYPSWGDFLDKQADSHNLPGIKMAKAAHQYEKAATLLEEHLGGSMEYTLMQIFGDHFYKAANRNPEMECLPEIFHNLIITTNFDEVIEMLYAKVNKEYIEKLTPKSMKDIELCHKRIACGEPTLIKLHGDVATREFVLTEQAYNDVYGKRILDTRLPLPTFLRDVLRSKTILFLGCSLEDDRTLQVVEQSQIDGSISFALLELHQDTENKDTPWKPNLQVPEFAKRIAFLNAHNIIPIWFPAGKYEALKIFLHEVSDQVASEYKFSTTTIQSRVKSFLDEGSTLVREGKNNEAFYCFANAAAILKRNPHMFSDQNRLDSLEKIKNYYNLNGYAFESRDIVKDILILTERICSQDKLAMCYHDLGYTYERYRYFKLMLKAMQRSQEILDRCRDKENNSEVLYSTAYIYMSLAYVYLKNNDNESAKEWYQKAEKLLSCEESNLEKDAKAFLYNGLYRYYEMLNEHDKAINTLSVALQLRLELYAEKKSKNEPIRGVLVHILNTHSNRIRMFLSMDQIENAEREFQACNNIDDIWAKEEYLRDSKRRILTDHGDILSRRGRFDEACEEYKKAFKYRKYLHFTEDFYTAELYRKIADCLEKMFEESQRQEQAEEALEYYIQSYVIFEKISIANSSDAQETMDKLSILGNRLSIEKDILEKRVSAQRAFMLNRSDDRLDNQQNELIEYFEL